MEPIDTLCIVDDDEIFRFFTQKVIERTNLVNRIKTFSNGLEAIRFLKSVQDKPEELPEIILLDLTMPVMDGWGFLEEYIQVKPLFGKKVVLCIVSSSIDPADRERARAISEVTDFIIKPMTRVKLLEMLKNL